uniref:Uncharacterized protein n=1 Tax=Bodo saltans TaxID=75058 RepID=B6DTD1_BODSA|nr:hypothetical protein [Bodo saltans]
MADSWERVLSGLENQHISSAIGTSAHVDTQDHYLQLWNSARSDPSSAVSSAALDVLRQAASAAASASGASSSSMPKVTMPSLRAKFALHSCGDIEFSQTLIEFRLAVQKVGLLSQQSIRLASGNLSSGASSTKVEDVALFTILLLSQYRSTKQIAARKWIAYMDSVLTAPSEGLSVGLVLSASFLASMSLCIPTTDVTSQRLLIAILGEALGDAIPPLHPQFIGLFWTAVIEQLSLREATTSGHSHVVSVKALMPVFVDYFYVNIAQHLQDAMSSDENRNLTDTSSCTRSSPLFHAIASPPASQERGLPPAVFDAYFGIFMPSLWQQIGFEWPWSSFVRLTRAIVNEARRSAQGSESIASALSSRAEQLWNDIAFSLAPRSYKQRLEEILAASLQRHVDGAYALDATRQFPLPVDDTVLADLGRVATVAATKISQLTPGDNAAISDAVGVATLSLDALPHMVRLRAAQKAITATRSADAALVDARMAGVLWIFLTLSKRLAVRSHNRDLFLTTFAPVLEKLRNSSEGAALGIQHTEEDDTVSASQLPTQSPFVTVASLWLASIVDNRRDDAERKALLRRRIGFELLRFMSVCYLPLTQDNGRSSVGLVITAADIIAVFVFAAGASAVDGSEVDARLLWATADSDLRMAVRDVMRRLSSLTSRIQLSADLLTFDTITRHIVRLESEQLTKWLRALAVQEDALCRGTSCACWIPSTAVLQATLSHN